MSPYYSPSLPSPGPFDPYRSNSPSPSQTGRNSPLMLSRDSYCHAAPSPMRSNPQLALPPIERPPSRSPSSLAHHGRSHSAGNLFPKSPGTPLHYRQDQSGHLVPSGFADRRGKTYHRQVSTPSSPHYGAVPPVSRSSSPSMGYFDLPTSGGHSGHSPSARHSPLAQSPYRPQTPSSRKHSPKNSLQMTLAAPPSGDEYKRSRKTSLPFDRPRLAPAPTSANSGSYHAKALAEACESIFRNLC